MNEDEAYEKLQDLRDLAEELIKSGYYSAEEIIRELESFLE